MFIDVHELSLHKAPIRQSYAPGALDFHSAEVHQVEPLEVRGTAELVDGQIRVTGNFQTRLELTCARCLDTVVEDVGRDFDLFYRSMTSIAEDDEVEVGGEEPSDKRKGKNGGADGAEPWGQTALSTRH